MNNWQSPHHIENRFTALKVGAIYRGNLSRFRILIVDRLFRYVVLFADFDVGHFP